MLFYAYAHTSTQPSCTRKRKKKRISRMSHFTEVNHFDTPFFLLNQFSLPLFIRPFHLGFFFTSSLVSQFYDLFSLSFAWSLYYLFALDLCRSIITIQCLYVGIKAGSKQTQYKICSTHTHTLGEREREKELMCFLANVNALIVQSSSSSRPKCISGNPFEWSGKCNGKKCFSERTRTPSTMLKRLLHQIVY